MRQTALAAKRREAARRLEKPFYSIEEAADILLVHPQTIRRHIRLGTLPAQKEGGRWRIPLPAIMALHEIP